MADSIKSVDVPSVHGMVALNPDGSAIGTPVGGATAANQTDGSQKTQIVDAGGEVATVTGGKLDVNATASLAGESIPATGATTAVSVQVVDGSGNQISSFGGGTQYADGAARGTATGTIAMGDDGTNIQSVHVDSSGDLQIDVLSSALPTGAATAANQQTDALTDTQLRATAVDVSVSTMPTTNVAQSGSWSVDLGNINGIATETTVAAIDTKTPALGQALAAASVPVVLPAAQITAITPPAAITGFATAANQLPDGHNVTVDNASLAVTGTFWQATQPVSMATNQPVGTIAHDSADSGNPIKVGGRAINAEITAIANNDRSDFITDLVGKQIVLPYANPENFVSGAITTAMTGTTSTSLVAAPAAGLRNYITTIIVSNAHASVGTDVVIQDGNAGTTLMTIPAAAVYGGAVINLPVPLRQPTTATAIYCANVTTGASTKVSAVGYKGV